MWGDPVNLLSTETGPRMVGSIREHWPYMLGHDVPNQTLMTNHVQWS